MSIVPSEKKEFLIVSITPQFLERGVLWFQENYEKVKYAIRNPSTGSTSSPQASSGNTIGFWQNNALIIEKDLEIKPGEFLRRISDFGYEKTGMLFGKGEFAHHGNIIDVWPINSDTPYKVEFFGNRVEAIYQFPISNFQFPKTKRDEGWGPKTNRGLKRLSPGDYIVHIDHGIGIFRGIVKNNPEHIHSIQYKLREKSEILRFAQNDEIIKEYFIVEYAPPRPNAEPDRLFVPIEQEKRLSPYIGFETPIIHRLGGNLWTKIKKRVREDAEKLAKELLKIYAVRESITRPPYKFDETMAREFADEFEFVETEDQTKAIEDIRKDFSRPQPMDRIICGDVGFGKTEVAMRAAFDAVANNYQVALISPTTILANEHKKNFEKRFEKFPVEICSLSRLTPAGELKTTLEKINPPTFPREGGGIKQGKCDIVIGTHRLLSQDVTFKDLGLVIVDEEQRFGVKQKEKFKELRASCDILSLSATPIPRTLNLAMAKLRDLSIISTPPPGRLPIKTFILPHSYKTFARAILAEIERNGQVYFLHNRIETIGIVKEKLEKAMSNIWRADLRGRSDLPKIEIIHGRMDERTMLRIMDEFRAKKIDVLLATTIIENGLDFSNANTLIVDDATRLGLAQAYQIRGRIGRGNKEAYAYFSYQLKQITEMAMERLLALKEFEELGSGYEVALRDLEMRGAGNILGREQSGAINRVGLNLYCQILADAVENLKNTKAA